MGSHRRARPLWPLGLVLGLWACTTPTTELVVQLVTDYAPTRDFDTITVRVEGAEETFDVTPGRSFGRPVRVAQLHRSTGGVVELSLALRSHGALVQTQPRRATVVAGTTTVVTFLITRDCASVTCPGAADPFAIACVGGRCVPPECTAEHSELCPFCPGGCPASPIPCVDDACRPEGVCFPTPVDERCMPGEICLVDTGCTGAGVDAGPPADTGAPPTDTGGPSDAGADANTDAFVCSCDDGIACNGVEVCPTGTCTTGTPVACMPRACETMICTEPSGTCEATPIDRDGDGEGASPCGDDCDDTNPDVHPGATEVCNRDDDDCDFVTDECPTAGDRCLRSDPFRCVTVVCGDDVVDPPEECDPVGADTPTDNCTPTCTIDECESPTSLGAPAVGTWATTALPFFWGVGDTADSCDGAGVPDHVYSIQASGAGIEIDIVRTAGGTATTHVTVWTGSCRGTEIGCGQSGDGGAPLHYDSVPVGSTVYLLIGSIIDIDRVDRTLRVRFTP